eukprot:364007_1
MEQQLLWKLRELTRDCLSKHHLPTARFYADKACIVSKYHHSDVYILAKIHFLNKEYHRCILVLQKYGLIPYSNHMGINDISFEKEEIILISNNKNNKNTNNKQQDLNIMTKQHKLQYLLLGMQSFLECGEYELCISMLSESDEIALQFIQPEFIKDIGSNTNQQNTINISSLLSLIRAKALEKLNIDQRALWWFERSLIFDCKNIQAFDCIIKRRLNTVSKLQIFIHKELHFKSDEEWIKFYYECKINEIGTDFDNINVMNKLLSENAENKLILSESNDLKIIKSNCLLNVNLFRESYLISSEIKSSDNYNILSLISHIICLVELGKQSELYKTSHDLICTYPDSAISWFSVGCYYYMTRRYEISRRFLHKATCLDKYFFAAWIVYGHTFSEQDADDQAMASYRTVHRYFPNSYQPLLFMGMGYLNMNNYIYAEKFLKEAYKLFDSDPMIYNELGVVYYQQKQYEKAKDFFNVTIKYISSDCYNTWETTFFNLGHCYRKLKQYKEALVCYNKALNISPNDPMILSAIAFTYHLQNKIDNSIEYYHKVLSLQPHDTFANEMLHRALQTASSNIDIQID